MLLGKEWASALDFFTTIFIFEVKKSFLMVWPLTKNFGSRCRRGHLGLGLSKAPLTPGLRCLIRAARAAVCAPSSLLSAVGAGPSREAGFCAELRVLKDEDPDRGARDVSEGHPQGCKSSTPRCKRRQRYQQRRRQPWLQIAVVWLLLATEPLPSAQPRSPWKEGGEGKRLRRRGRAGSAARRALAPARALWSLRTLTAAVRQERPKGSQVGGVAASGASNYWRPPWMQHGSWGSKTGFLRPAGEAGAVACAERPQAPFQPGIRLARAPDSELGRAQGSRARGSASPSPLDPLFSIR